MKNAVELAASRELTDLEKQGMIQGFEFTNYYCQLNTFAKKMDGLE